MTFIEFVGFLVSLFALIFLFLKKTWEEEKKRRNPEEFRKQQHKQKEQMQVFLKELGIDPEPYIEEEPEPEPEPPKPPPASPKPIVRERQVTWDYDFESTVEEQHLDSVFEETHLEPNITDKTIEVDDRVVVSEQMAPSELTKEAYKVDSHINPSKSKNWLSNLSSHQDLLIAHEVFKKPPGLREKIEPYSPFL